MGLLSPFYVVVVPFLLLCTIPLAVFAGLTTMLAFSWLTVRVSLVYLELALRAVPQYLLGERRLARLPSGSSPTSAYSYYYYNALPAAAPGAGSPSGASTPSLRRTSKIPTRSGSRRLSVASNASSVENVQSFGSAGSKALASGSTGLRPSVGIDRDFEGVGGWRLSGGGDDEDSGWTRINSRLELLEPGSPLSRHHQRSMSVGGSRYSAHTSGEGSWLMMKPARKDGALDGGFWGKGREGEQQEPVRISPNSSRLRLPTAAVPAFTAVDRQDDYFPPMASPKAAKKSAIGTSL